MTTTSLSTRVSRSIELDIARAIAVIGVVVNHSGVLSLVPEMQEANWELSAARLPVICFVIGLFIPGGVAKKGGAHGYIRRRVMFLLWVYVIWFLIQATLEYFARSRSSPLSIFALWESNQHLWFLPFVAVGTALVVLLRPWEKRWTLGLLIALSLATWGWAPPYVGADGIANVAFLALGAALGKERAVMILRTRPGSVLAAGIFAVPAFIACWLRLDPVPARDGEIAGIPTALASFLSCLLGILIAFACAVVLARIPGIGAALAWVGRRTIAVYVAHMAVLSAGANAIGVLNLTSGARDVASILVFILGVLVPLALYAASEHARMRWLFQPPTSLFNLWPGFRRRDAPGTDVL